MKKTFILFMVLLGFFFTPASSNAQWSNITKYDLRYCQSLTCLGDYVFASIRNHLYRTDNNGDYWKLVNHYSTCRIVTCINENILMSTYDGVMRSTNYGDDWNIVFSQYPPLENFVVNEGLIYGSRFYNGVYVSYDLGCNWVKLFNGVGMHTFIACFDVHGDSIYVGNYNGLYFSTDNGTSWKELLNGYTQKVRTNGYYLCAYTDSLRVSTNNGTTWVRQDNSLPHVPISSINFYNSNIYVSFEYNGGIYRSTNKGVSWHELSDDLRNYVINCIDMSENEWYAGTKSGVVRSADKGATWISTNTGLMNKNIISINNINSKKFIGVSNNGAYKGYKSIIGGLDWAIANHGIETSNVQNFVVIDSTIFVGTTNNGIFRSTNEGGEWININQNIGSRNIKSVITKDSTLFLCTDTSGIYYSMNKGNNWLSINNGLPDLKVRCLAYKDSTLFAGTESSGVFYSKNNMYDWNSLNEGLPSNTMVNLILVHNSIVYVGTNTGLYRYSPGGECWIKIQLELSGGIIKKMAADNQQLYMVVERGLDGEMLFIVDTGTFAWNRVALPYDVSVINDLSVIDSELYLCCPIGLMKIPTNQITFTLIENESENKLISQYTLNQNYPNPFNPSTTISFSLPNKEFVTLKIYDALGKEITTLVNEELNAGSYKNDWNAGNLTSGVYFYRLQAGKFSQTRKLMLVK